MAEAKKKKKARRILDDQLYDAYTAKSAASKTLAIVVRITPNERKVLEFACRNKGMGISTWIRQTLRDTAIEELRVRLPDPFASADRYLKTLKEEKEAGSQAEAT